MITWLSNFIHLLQISNSLKFGFIELSLCQQRKPSSSSSHLYFLSSAFVLLYLTSHSLFWVAYPQITDFFFSFFLSLECFQQSTNQSGDLNEDAGSTDFKLIFFLLYNYIFFYSVVFFCFCCYWYIYIYNCSCIFWSLTVFDLLVFNNLPPEILHLSFKLCILCISFRWHLKRKLKSFW